MPWNVLLLPLLAGYLYCTRCNKAKFKYRQADGNRLLLASALHGVAFLLFATLFILCADWLAVHYSPLEALVHAWKTGNPYPHLGKSFLALILSFALTALVNHFTVENDEMYNVLQEEDGIFELLLMRSVDETRALLLTLDNQKVYVAVALDRLRIDRKHLNIMPLWSGYRHKETQQVILTTNYKAVYDNVTDRKDIGLIIPADRITSVTLFDIKLYAEHFSPKVEPAAAPTVEVAAVPPEPNPEIEPATTA